MKVSLIQYDADALELLLFTKQTRLKMAPLALQDIRAWPEDKKMAELDYMLGTINSSWEFSTYTFVIEDVTRAFTHQLVRHRVGVSFAQQAQRAVDMSGFEYLTGPSITNHTEAESVYDEAMDDIDLAYRELIEHGVNPQDARGILPTNILTNIVMRTNLRTLHEMALIRLCVKAQGEFQDVMRALRDAVLAVHPWAARFIKVHCAFHGTCAFPSFPVSECPVKPIVYDPVTRASYGYPTSMHSDYTDAGMGTLEEIEERWAMHRAEAQPHVKGSFVPRAGNIVFTFECPVCRTRIDSDDPDPAPICAASHDGVPFTMKLVTR